MADSRELLHQQFVAFSGSDYVPFMYTMGFLVLNFIVVGFGVKKGIERVSNLLMPVLFLLLIVFCINSISMSKASDGIAFLFKPDFAQISPGTVIAAMGQAFFSLSIGIGTMMTYASYFSPSTRLGRTAVMTAVLDLSVAILAGIIIFPAVFTYGFSPEAGPALVFEVLPAIFSELPFGQLWSVLFFFLLFIASLTSTISMSEIPIKFLIEKFGLCRRGATLTTAVIAMLLGTLCAFSFGLLGDVTILGLTFFELFDYLASNVILPLGGFIVAVYVGWFLDKDVIKQQMTNNAAIGFLLMPVLLFCLRFVAPFGILLVFLNAIGVKMF